MVISTLIVPVKTNAAAKLNLKNGTANVSGAVWSSSDASVATVADGLVTAVADGTATIKAAKYGKECTCTVNVDGFVFSRDVTVTAGRSAL